MTRVRCILVETTFPVRIRPRMETIPVNGHFLSVQGVVSVCSSARPPRLVLANTQNSLQTADELQASPVCHIPMYEPSIAVLGVLKPSPTSLYQRFPAFAFFALTLELRKM